MSDAITLVEFDRLHHSLKYWIAKFLRDPGPESVEFRAMNEVARDWLKDDGASWPSRALTTRSLYHQIVEKMREVGVSEP